MHKLLIKNASQIITCKADKVKKGNDMQELGIIENGSIYIEDGIIKKIGNSSKLKSYEKEDVFIINAKNKIVLPGFIDSHTHFVFGGYRDDEYSWRLAGMDYMEIMNRGGGIAKSVNQTREASEEKLFNDGIKRLNSFANFGVTTVEGKSGYGLDLETEIKQLRVMKKLNSVHSLDIVSTFLGAHSVPSEYKGRSSEYIDFIISDVLPVVVENDLAEFCDIFTEKNVFSVEESKKLLLSAKNMGLKLKMHADEIVQIGGTELAGELKAISADHLLQASDEGLKSLKDNDVVATLLPATAFSLQEDFARARYIIDNGGAVAVASDFNPGSCHTESIPLLIALSTIKMKMTIEETINALTINAAKAIDREKFIGSLEVGKKADIVIHDCNSYKFLAYHIGVNTVEKVIKNGKMILDKEIIGVL
ncbi:MAG: imidazolonepropionase [Bacillota bacterium]|nr:imidazolonepropionase [Bacillota bacterium]